MTETILRNARVVLPEEVIAGAVVVRDGVIHDIGPRSSSGEDLDGGLHGPVRKPRCPVESTGHLGDR